MKKLVLLFILLFLSALVVIQIYYRREVMILPSPSGPYKVGTEIFNWIDINRSETFSNDPTTRRELIVQLWYPTKESGKYRKYAQEFLELWKEGLIKKGFSQKDVNQLESLKSYEIDKAPINKKECPYPIIFFCHGYAAMRFAYSSFIQELASNGYIVVGIGHTYYAQIIKFLDGRIVYSAPENSSQKNLINENSSQIQQKTWIQDIDFTLAKLKELNKEPAYFNCFDFNNIGIFGHSFGGATAIQLARSRDYIKAAADLDGALFGPNATEGFNKPIFFLLGGKTIENFKNQTDEQIANHLGWPQELITVLRKKYMEYIPTLIKNMHFDAYYVEIPEADHGAFSDWVLLKDLPLYKENKALYNMEAVTGAINGETMISIVNSYLLAFFNKFLKMKNEPILLKVLQN